VNRRRITTTGAADTQDPDDPRLPLLPEADLELIDALQINPRVTWAQLGDVLGVDPVTVTRRW
jgi:hypothetical protein